MEEGLKSYLEQLVEGLIDEDEGNKDGENFLRKTWDKADKEASFEGHGGHHDDNKPNANPHAGHQVFQTICRAELFMKEDCSLECPPTGNIHKTSLHLFLPSAFSVTL